MTQHSEMKPSERITEIAEEMIRKGTDGNVALSAAIAIYLDEQHEAQHSKGVGR